ncbi:MAG TPA: aspartate carbamoyltransferase regulatory subunit [Candidatus Enterocola sp.]|mgnify:FL=1|jgi:aspartate carbamoyltransferase regulatory subunit|nr:aspartate carbamoyltransferase regulatory subunit [Candidatus Enterocola sp.]
MKASHTELIVRALENGTVIDHIPADKLFKVVWLLHLDNLPNQITIGNNLESKKIICKGIIKISDKFFEHQELDKIALIAPTAKINIIKNYEVVEKIDLSLPNEVTEILQCVNPMCITNKENGITTRFHIVDKAKGTVKCHYCERIINQEDLILK